MARSSYHQIPIQASPQYGNRSEVVATATLNKLTTRLETLKGSDYDFTQYREINETEDHDAGTPASGEEFDDRYPIVGVCPDKDSEQWSELPTCPVAQANDFSPSWSNPIVEFVQKEELNRALGFWMNIKKPMEGPRCPYVKLQEDIGTNEVLTKSQTPVTPSPAATDCSDAAVEASDNDLASSIPIDIGKSIKKFFPSILESRTAQTPPMNKSREASTGRSVNTKTVKSKRRLSRTRNSLMRLTSSRRRIPAPPTPPRSPGSSHREARQQMTLQQLSPSSSQMWHESARASQALSLTASPAQRSRAPSRQRSQRRFARCVAQPRSPQHALRNRNTPAQSGARWSSHKLVSRTSTSPRSPRQLSISHTRLPELGKFTSRSSTIYRHNPPRTRRVTSPGSRSRPSTSYFGLPRNLIPTESQSKYNVKKKKKTRPKSPSASSRPKTTPSQISRVCPLLDFSRSRNAFQQTDNNLTSTSIQANLLPPQVIEVYMDESKAKPVPKTDTTSEGTQTILTSESKCVMLSVSNNTDEAHLKPLLMSRTAQTNPRVKNSKVATRSFANGRFTDSDVSMFNSQTNIDKQNKFCRNFNRPGILKANVSSTTSAVSSLATDSKKFASRQSSFSRYSHLSRSSLYDVKTRKTHIQLKLSNDTNGTEEDLKSEPVTNELQEPNVLLQESVDFLNCKEQCEVAPNGINKRENQFRTSPKRVRTIMAKPTAEVSPKASNPTSGELDTKTSQLPISSLPSDKEMTEEKTISEVCDKPFNRFVNRLRSTQMRFPTIKNKLTPNSQREKDTIRRDTSKFVHKYGTLSHPALNLAKSKVVTSMSMKGNLSVSNSRIKSNRISKTNKAPQNNGEDNSKLLVNKNINMLVEACQNLLSEAMKESKTPLSNTFSKQKYNQKTEPSTQETVAWILQTLKNTYGNWEPLNKSEENGYIAVIEQECQTCTKSREVSASTEQHNLSKDLNIRKESTTSLVSLVSSLQTASSNTKTITQYDSTKDEIKKCFANMASSGLNKNPSDHTKSLLRTAISKCPLKGEVIDNDLLHLNCGKFQVALRQVSDNPSRVPEKKESSSGSQIFHVDDSVWRPESSVRVVSNSSTTILPSSYKSDEVAPVTKVSLWSKNQIDTELNGSHTNVKQKFLTNETAPRKSESLDASSNVLETQFHEGMRLQSQSDINKKGHSFLIHPEDQHTRKFSRTRVLEFSI